MFFIDICTVLAVIVTYSLLSSVLFVVWALIHMTDDDNDDDF